MDRHDLTEIYQLSGNGMEHRECFHSHDGLSGRMLTKAQYQAAILDIR